MPIITVDGPKIEDMDRKRKFVKKLTEAAVEAYDIPDIIVLIKETTPDNVGVRGVLVSDRPKK